MNWASYAKSKWEILAGRLAVFLMFKEVIGDTLLLSLLANVRSTDLQIVTAIRNKITPYGYRIPKPASPKKHVAILSGFLRAATTTYHWKIPLVMQTETEKQFYYRVNCALPYGVL